MNENLDSAGPPPGWVAAKLSEVADVQLGKTPSKSQYRDTGKHKVVKFRDLEHNRIEWNNCSKGFVESATDVLGSLKPVQLNDVLLTASAHSSEHIGRKAVRVTEIPDPFAAAYVVGEILRVRPERSIDPRWILYFLQSLDGYKEVQRQVRGVHLISSRARQITLPIAPSPTQERIVEAIEEQFTRLDSGVAALKRVEANLKRYKAAVLKAACEGKLTEKWRQENPDVEPASELLKRILSQRRRRWEEAELAKMLAKGKPPENDKWKEKYKEPTKPADPKPDWLPASWEWVTWDQIGVSQNGRAFPSKEYSPGGIHLLRPGNLHIDGDVRWTEKNTRYMPESWADAHPDYIVGECELIMNLTAQSLKDEFLGRVCMTEVGDRCLLNQRLARLTPILACHNWLLWLFKSSIFRQFVQRLNTGSLIQHMFTSQLAEFCCPLPPLEEQDEVASEIERRLSIIEDAQQVGDSGMRRASRLRQSILKRAFEGKLVDQDPDDEPAVALLERIETERSKHPAGQRTKLSRQGQNAHRSRKKKAP